MRRTTWIAVVIALAACHCESGPPVRTSAVPQSEEPSASPAVREHMAAHLAAATQLQSAIAQGRLADARDQARWFVAHDMAGPPQWEPYIGELRDAAMRIVRASDVSIAGAQLGRFGRACSSCHEREGASLAFSYASAPPDGDTLDAQMQRHQWAAARLWEGVIGGDRAWQDGTRVMATARIDLAQTMHAKPNDDVVELAERLRDQATRALAIRDRATRATLYGDMMETCASCHSIVRPSPAITARQE